MCCGEANLARSYLKSDPLDTDKQQTAACKHGGKRRLARMKMVAGRIRERKRRVSKQTSWAHTDVRHLGKWPRCRAYCALCAQRTPCAYIHLVNRVEALMYVFWCASLEGNFSRCAALPRTRAYFSHDYSTTFAHCHLGCRQWLQYFLLYNQAPWYIIWSI